MRILFFILMLFVLAAPAHAQLGMNPDRNEPLEITADQTLEWHRGNKQYIARGNVIVRQGNVTIMADTLTADYRETTGSAFEIYRLTADGNVRIVSQGNTATGQQATYDVDRSVAVMTGDNLSLHSPDQTVTAKESFEYWVAEGRLVGRGNARVTRMGDTLDADSISAVFEEHAGSSDARQLKNLGADGHVKITTENEVLTGEKARYESSTNIAELTGNVKITRGPNVLEGQRAEVNLTTNVSKMHGGSVQGGDGRVRGVFYPGSEQKNAAPQDNPAPGLPSP